MQSLKSTKKEQKRKGNGQSFALSAEREKDAKKTVPAGAKAATAVG